MKVMLVGAGPMAIAYSKVLDAMQLEYVVIGRGGNSASEFEKITGHAVIRGGLDNIKKETLEDIDKAIVAVEVSQLGEVTRKAIDFGVKNILVEKPGGLTKEDILKVRDLAGVKGSNVYIGYNRRHYASVRRAKEIIKEDGGVTSFHFEFTEWSHVIEPLKKAEGVKEAWLLANSSHVIDMAFYLGGQPKEMDSHMTGSLNWHPSAARFAGAGVSENGALFSYNADWDAPGRWGVEILTRKHRLFFRPLEKLQIQNIGSVKVEDVELHDDLDIHFKPGLFLQVKYFLDLEKQELLTIEEQCKMLKYYDRISGNR